MISYYHNPRTEDLIIWDPEEDEIFIIERIKNIKVFTEKEIEMGDDGRRGKSASRRKSARPKTKSGRTRITPEVISEIKRLRSELKSGREISEELGISEGAVWKYLKK